jgi:SAM-dependent methyltransferase
MYDDREAVAAYERLFGPLVIAPFAEDLVREVDPPAGGRVLDVGAGTGVASVFAARAVGPRGVVIAAEPSLAMLAIARGKVGIRPLSASAPGLPFRAGEFDAAIASFVLSHITDTAGALTDIARVVGPGGRVGVTAWVMAENPASAAWTEVAGRFISLDLLAAAFREHIPWEAEFSDEARLAAALGRAGLSRIAVKRADHLLRVSAGDFLAMREASIEGRLVVRTLAPPALAAMRQELAATFQKRFDGRLEYVRTALVATGAKGR